MSSLVSRNGSWWSLRCNVTDFSRPASWFFAIYTLEGLRHIWLPENRPSLYHWSNFLIKHWGQHWQKYTSSKDGRYLSMYFHYFTFMGILLHLDILGCFVLRNGWKVLVHWFRRIRFEESLQVMPAISVVFLLAFIPKTSHLQRNIV